MNVEEEAERVLRNQGLSPERCGADDWAQAMREVTEQLLGRTVPPVRRVGRLLPPQKTSSEPSGNETAPIREFVCTACEDSQYVNTATRVINEAAGVRIGSRPIPCPSCVPLSIRAALAGIPVRYRNVSLDTLVERHGNEIALQSAHTWEGTESVVLASRSEEGDDAYGTGKTQIGCAMLISQIQRARPARFLQVQDYLENIKRLFDVDGDSAEAYAQRIALEPLLMLDDVGKEQGTPWQRAQLFSLIDTRYRAMYPTIITTNKSYAELVDTLGGAFVDRLNDARWVFVGGKSWRGQQ